MARIPRNLILENNSYFHVTWKCHNDDFLLRDDRIKAQLHALLKKYKLKFGVKIYGYCFMDNHPHIIGYMEDLKEFSKFFQTVNGLLARYINKVLGRRGQVVMDRFHSPMIETEKHMLNTLHYVELNPVRAGICKRVHQFRWSSYHAHANGQVDTLLDPLPETIHMSFKSYRSLSAWKASLRSVGKTLLVKTYFIGSPHWMRLQRRDLYLQLLCNKQKGNNHE